ncbi:Rv3654c family TadE-like protein [uncultured Jatrophihabitans sp.]|uniref:Rv3654c family TadE-like protein n=1 Tax=uncultured Jatrophihabitans sp. TaxID=1610747 RepID=UPI0035CB30B4
MSAPAGRCRARRPARPRRAAGERGSASLWVLAGCSLLLVVAAAATLRGLAVLARSRAEAGADLAALAGAAQIGVSSASCSAAAIVARRNAARLVTCSVSLDPAGRSGTVTVRVSATAWLPLVGSRAVSATARAGRLPS